MILSYNKINEDGQQIMSAVERGYRYEEPELKPALSLVEDLPETPSAPVVLTPKNFEALRTAVGNRRLPFEIVEGVEFEDELLLRLAKHKLLQNIKPPKADIKSDMRTRLTMSLSTNNLAGDDFAELLATYKSFAELSIEHIRASARTLGIEEFIWPPEEFITRTSVNSNPDWREFIDKTKEQRLEEKRDDAIAVGRDYFLANGEAATGQYLNKLHRTQIFPTKSEFLEIFPDISEFYSRVEEAVSEYYEAERQRLVRHQELLDEIDKADLPPGLFTPSNGEIITKIEKARRFARYLVASAFVTPESADKLDSAIEIRVNICTKHYSRVSKSFYREVMNRCLVRGVDNADDEDRCLSRLDKGEIQNYVIMNDLIGYIDPEIEADNLKRLRKLRDDVDNNHMKQSGAA